MRIETNLHYICVSYLWSAYCVSIKQSQPTTTSTYILKFYHKFTLTTINLLVYDGELSRQGETEEDFEEIE